MSLIRSVSNSETKRQVVQLIEWATRQARVLDALVQVLTSKGIVTTEEVLAEMNKPREQPQSSAPVESVSHEPLDGDKDQKDEQSLN